MAFIVSLLILILMLLNKIIFFLIEKDYYSIPQGYVSFLFFISLLVVGIIYYFKEFNLKPRKILIKSNISIVNILLFFLVGIFIVLTLQINLQKIAVHWDAIALYDARAIFLIKGIKFSSMANLSLYDNLNQYYYLLYPPYTSISHYIWRSSDMLSKLPVSVYYSFLQFVMAISIIFITKIKLGIKYALILSLLALTNSSIFNITIKEYTNLPYTIHVSIGVLLLSIYIETKKKWSFFFGLLLLSSSIWIRLLEPIWLAAILAFVVSASFSKKLYRHLGYAAIILIICVLEYYSWTFFTKNIGNSPGFLDLSPLSLIEPVAGIFTGAPMLVASNIVKNWFMPFLLHSFAIVAIIAKNRKILNERGILFLGLFIIFSVLIYFAEFYFIAFQADWWEIVTMSLDRSSTFLIPISGYILFRLLTLKED